MILTENAFTVLPLGFLDFGLPGTSGIVGGHVADKDEIVMVGALAANGSSLFYGVMQTIVEKADQAVISILYLPGLLFQFICGRMRKHRQTVVHAGGI